MKLLSPRFFPLIASAILFLSAVPLALASDDSDAREVRLSSVAGDVRLSRGNGKRPDLNKPWEQALAGESVEQGFALATGDGRAEIEFEDGSMVYLAKDSLLLFTELSAPGDEIITSMTLAAGTATFDLRPLDKETFFVQTSTANMEVSKPEAFYSRVDAYLDATAITPQDKDGERLTRTGHPALQLKKGQTVFFRWGVILGSPNSAPPELPAEVEKVIAASLREYGDRTASLRAIALIPAAPTELIPQSPAELLAAQKTIASTLGSSSASFPSTSAPPAANDWDSWVSTRVDQQTAAMTAALRASGLSSPVPGLAEMYEHGRFFNCGEYGTCWEPSQGAPEMDLAPQTSAPAAQSSTPGQSPAGFQLQRVEWQERWATVCGFGLGRKVSRLARTPEELQELLRRKEMAESAGLSGGLFTMDCYTGEWFRHHGHYVKVVTPRHPPSCPNAKCKPGKPHPPRRVWVRAGNQVGFVPRHPKDVAGKPPINLKNGLIVPSSKPGQPARLVALDPSQKISVLDKAPKEFQTALSPRAPAVSAPVIRAQFMPEKTRGGSVVAANRASPPITYSYKTHQFMTTGTAGAGAKSREVAVAGLTSHGGVASFAGGNSRGTGVSGRSSGAGSGSNSSGSRSSGGGQTSGSHSSAGSSGSHSSSSGSSGGSSAHSSGGGSSSSSSSSSSSASAGGGSHH